VVSIDKTDSLHYEFYTEYLDDCSKLNELMDEYNSEVEAYNDALGGRKKLTEPEYSKFESWATEIENKQAELEEMLNGVGYCWAKPMGIVETVDIYW
jgi:hypothetical protein